MNLLRHDTPDSEAVASSGDEGAWPSSSFGSLPPRRDSSLPGLPNMWSTQRGSFSGQSGPPRIPDGGEVARMRLQRDHSKGTRGASNPVRQVNTPSPVNSEGSGVTPFQAPLQSNPKVVRSMSHSQGQREALNRPTNPSAAPASALPLGLLAEDEVDTETESELGEAITQTMSHPPGLGSLQRTSTYPSGYGFNYGNKGQDSDYEETPTTNGKFGRKLEHALTSMTLDQPARRPQWHTSLGWDDLPNITESRRHSLADIPTRRGSVTGEHPLSLDSVNGQAQARDLERQLQEAPQKRHVPSTSTRATSRAFGTPFPCSSTIGTKNMGNEERYIFEYTDFSRPPIKHRLWDVLKKPSEPDEIPDNKYEPFQRRRFREELIFPEGAVQYDSANRPHVIPHARPQRMDAADKLGLPAQYHVPIVTLEPHERSARPLTQTHPANRSKQKHLYVVSFKCARVEIFYLMDNTGLDINEGDMVIVEADRGQDLGMVQHARVTPDEARILKRKYSEEQYKWLMMFSMNNHSGNVNPNAPGALGGTTPSAESSNMAASRGGASAGGLPSKPYNMPGSVGGPMISKDDLFNLKPKAIKRIANANEVRMLMEKEGNEAKAKRTCQHKVNLCRLDMEILDAEWQWDFNKIIFYYYADHYINFQGLITELYRIYKTRIWLSAVNPASFSPAATGQMPFGFGPGAILNVMGGQDPDPHGAVRPYSVGYETYDPNYPAIPGVPNSYPPMQVGGSNYQGVQYQSSPIASPNLTQADLLARQNMAVYNYNSMMGSFGTMQIGGDGGGGGVSLLNAPQFNQPSSAGGGNPSPQSWNAQRGDMQKSHYLTAPGRMANPPAPIGTRPQSGGNTGSPAGDGGGGGGGGLGAFGGGMMGRGAENYAAAGASNPRMNLTFGSMPYSTAGGSNSGGSHPDDGGVDLDGTARMRAYLEHGGAHWGREQI